MQQTHHFKRNLFTLKIVGNTFPAHSFFPNAFLSPPQKMHERLLGVLCKHLFQGIFPQCHSFVTCAVPGHTAPSFPCCPGRGVCWLPGGGGSSCCWPPSPEPSCCPMHPLWEKPIGSQAQWNREEGHKEGCRTEIKCCHRFMLVLCCHF